MKVKRILGAILSIAMAISVVPSALADTDAAAMERALITVKSRIDISSELSEFRSNSYEYDNATRYSFSWSDRDGDERIDVSCNSNGQVLSYNYYVSGSYRGGQKLPSVSKDEVRAAAEAFLAKAAPETVADENDSLRFVSARGGYDSSYTVEFAREKNGVTVSDNNASINTELNEDGEIYVSYAYINYSYGAKFEEESEKIESPEEKYEETYPAELVYRSKYDYSLYRNGRNYEPQLVYRIKDNAPGYISAYTGEIVEREYEDYADRNATMNSMAAADEGAYSGGGLTKQEISELETVAGLYTATEAEKFLRSLEQLKIDKDYKVSYSSVSTRGDDKDKSYILSLSMGAPDEDDYSKLNASFDAAKARLTSYAYYSYDFHDQHKEEFTDEEKSMINSEIDAFLKAVLPDKIGEFEDATVDNDSLKDYILRDYMDKNYRRIVNGIPYIGNTISVTYDVIDEKITRYNLTYDDDAEFSNPEGALSAEDAYEYMKEVAPIDELYIYSDGMYRLVYTMNGSPMIDAFTGEDVYKDENIDYTKVEYDDISGHWCEKAVNALKDYGIALPGESFNPDAQITQEELLRLFTAGIHSRYYINYDADSVYDECFRSRVLTKDERNDDAAVTREQAFVYMIRLAGYEKIAALSDIYKVSYADGGALSDGLIGYAAILSGMGIIEGDGGNIRPKDSITRAEAAVMLYRYMS